MKYRDYWLKRPLDFMLALAGLFISLPLWLLFALAIFLEDGLPVFYSQERVGRWGKCFKNIKFRSMIKDAELNTGPIQAKENDPRITRTGRFLRKTAMDELPQLLNIIKGDMSFVGPRPLRPKEAGAEEEGEVSCLFGARCEVRPGLTGVAQVFAPRNIQRKEKVEYDLWYIKNQGVILDITLILKSFWVSLSRKWDTLNKPFGGHRLN